MADVVEVVVLAKDQTAKVFSGIKSNLSAIGTVATGAMLGGLTVAAGGVAALGAAAFSASNDTRTAMLDMQAQFGLTADEADRASQLARDAWADNWGESIGDVGNVMGTVIQQLGEFGVVSDEEITGATTAALALRDAFETDTAMSIDAARALMERFGLTSEQAFDMMTTGLQEGLSANGDFLESITEYAPVFADAGFSAEQMYAIMESGASSGVLGTDKISDAIKEMGVILGEGGERAETAFKAIGLNFNEIAGFVEAGDETWADYFDDIVAGINGIEDPLERQRVQVQIFGTMAEDMGVGFTEALTSMGASLEDMEGATDSIGVKYESLGALFEGGKRTIIDAITPITDMLLDWGVAILPQVQAAVGGFAERLSQAADVFRIFFNALGEGMSPMNAFIEAIWDIAPQEVLIKLVDFRDNILPGLMENFNLVKDAVLQLVTPIFNAATQFVSWKDILIVLGGAIAATVIPAVIGLIAALAPVILTVGAVVGVVALLRNAWEQNWGGIQEKTQMAIAFIQEAIQTGLAFITDFWNQHGATILATVQQVWGTIQTAIATVVTWIQTNIPTTIGGVLEWWNNNWPQIQATIETVWGLIQGVIRSAVAVIEPAIKALVSNAQSAMGNLSSLVEPLQNLWAKVGPFVQAAATVIGGILVGLVGVVVGVVSGISQAIEPLINTFINVAENIILIVTGIIEFFTGFFNILIGLFTGNSELIQQAWEQMGQGLTDIVTGLYNGIIALFEGLIDTVIALVEGFVEGVVDFFTNLYDELVGNSIIPDLIKDIVSWFEDLITWIGDVLRGLWAAVSEPFVNMWNSLTTWFGQKAGEAAQLGKDIIQGIVNGLRSAGNAIKDTIMSFVQSAWDAVKAFFGISSPSTLMHWAGQMIAQGLIDGIKSKIDDAAEATQALFDAIGKVSGLGGGFGGIFQANTLDPMKEQLDGLTKGIEDTVAMLGDALPEDFLSMEAGQRQLLLQELAGTGFLAANEEEARARVLLQLLHERSDLNAEYIQQQERLAQLAEQQAQLNFLQQQFDLLKMIKDNDLGADILEGLQLGLDADAGGLMDAMVEAMRRMIEAAEDELQIASPSGWAKDTAMNVIGSMADTFRRGSSIIQDSLSIVPGRLASSAGVTTNNNGATFNIDLRGSQRGVERDVEAAIERVIGRYGLVANARMRTG